MIPKTIHYCWFGGNPKPKLAKKCIKSWKKLCPDYKIIEWNESNFDISSAPLYVRQAYEATKWAFVTDYVRLKVVYDNGGIYLDTDVQLLKNLDDLLKYQAYFGFEDDSYVNTGLGFGAVKHSKIINDILEQYKDIPFIKEDGTFDRTSCPKRNTEVFKQHRLLQNGETQMLDGGIIVFSKDYFCPKSYYDGIIRETSNTYSIHHYDASWLPKEQLKEKRAVWRISLKNAKKEYRYKKIGQILKIVLGPRGTNIVKKNINMRRK